jgi:PEP-CTERM motif
MPRIQRSLIALFSLLAITLLIPGKVLGDGLKLGPAKASVSGSCGIGETSGSGPYQTFQKTTASDTSAACDVMLGSGAAFDQAVATAAVTLGLSPQVDVMASVPGVLWLGSSVPVDQEIAYVEATAKYSTAVESIGTPPVLPSNVTIPMTLSWRGEVQESFSHDGGVRVEFKDKDLSIPGAYDFNVVPGKQYPITVSAWCNVGSVTGIGDECQAVADPTLTFNQAAFDAEMAAAGLPTYSLSQYYGFAYSPNLTSVSTPEPSSLMLLGIGLLGLAGLTLKKINL